MKFTIYDLRLTRVLVRLALVSAFSLQPSALHAATGVSPGATASTFIPAMTGSNTLTIDVNGNDTLAAANPYHALWAKPYDITAAPTNSWSESYAHGALTAAKSGDWIVFNPGVYLLASIPLNRYGNGQSNGVNLYIPEGVTIIRTNFEQQNRNDILGREASTGPLIIPGNNSIIVINGTILCTNEPGGADAVIGFNGSAQGYTGFANKFYYGFTNWIPTSFFANGSGFLNPPWLRGGVTNIDTVYMITGTGTPANNTNTCKAYIANLHMWAQWDNIFGSQQAAGNVTLITDHVTTVSDPNGFSIGVSWSSGGAWTDYGSTFTSMSGVANPGTVTANGIFANVAGNIFLNGTTFRLLNGAGVLFNLSAGAVVSGNYILYQEGTTTNLSHWTTSTNTAGYFSGNGSLLTGVVINQRSGNTNLASLATSQVVTFSTPFAPGIGTNYAVSLQYDISLAGLVTPVATSKTTNGFTITLTTGITGAESVDWLAIPYQ